MLAEGEGGRVVKKKVNKQVRQSKALSSKNAKRRAGAGQNSVRWWEGFTLIAETWACQQYVRARQNRYSLLSVPCSVFLPGKTEGSRKIKQTRRENVGARSVVREQGRRMREERRRRREKRRE